MRNLITAVLLSAIALSAQITVSPTEKTVYRRQVPTSPYGLYNPRHVKFTVTGPVGCTVKIVNPTFDGSLTNVSPVRYAVSGTAPSAANTGWNTYTSNSTNITLPVDVFIRLNGTEYTRSVSLGFQTNKVFTINGNAGTSCEGMSGTFTYKMYVVRGIPNWGIEVGASTVNQSGCTQSTGAGYWPNADFKNLCPMSDDRPNFTTFSMPAVGSSITDSLTGRSMRRLSNLFLTHNYQSITSYSSDNRYFIAHGGTYTGGASDTIIDTLDASVVTTVAGDGGDSVSAGGKIWLPSKIGHGDHAYLSINQANGTFTRKVVGGGSTLLVDMPSGIGSGGDQDVTADGRYAFMTCSSDSAGTCVTDNICVADFSRIQSTADQSANVKCAAHTSSIYPTGPSLYFLNGAVATPVDSETGYRYIIATVSPYSAIYRQLGTGGELEFWMIGPEVSDSSVMGSNGDGVCDTMEYCFPSGHMDVTQDKLGRVWVVYNLKPGIGELTGAYIAAAFRPARGKDMFHPVEAGGGWIPLYYQQGSAFAAASETAGCSHNGICTISSGPAYRNSGNTGIALAAFRVSAATAANPTVVTLTVTPNAGVFTVGGAVHLSSTHTTSTFTSCLEGKHTISAVSGNQLTIDADCSGASSFVNSYPNLTYLYKADNTWGNQSLRGEVIAVDLTNRTLKRAIYNRAVGSCEASATGGCNANVADELAYYSYPRPSPSMDGSRFSFSSNLGYLGQTVAFETQLDMGDPKLKFKPSSTSALACYEIDVAQTGSLSYSTTYDMASPTTVTFDTAATSGCVTIPSLTASTTYYVTAQWPATNPVRAIRKAFVTKAP